MIGLAEAAAAGLLLLLAGRLLTPVKFGPAVHLIAGWGGLCLALTLWGIVTPVSLRWPAYGFALAGLAGLVIKRRAPITGDLGALGRILALALPLIAVLARMQPSQPDIFLNLMPNAAYLFDHAAFPTEARPPSYSFLPVAPYNTQLVPFLGSLLSTEFAANGLALFTLVLHLAVALLFARIVAGERPPGWRDAGWGLALATFLDPGFVPRISFAGYGEAPIAITLVFASWLALDAIADLRTGRRWPAALWPLALTLAALINIKQQAIGVYVAFLCSVILVAGLDRRIGWRRAVPAFGVAAMPAAALYLLWRGFVLGQFQEGELKPLPFAEWQWRNLPEISLSMAKVVVEKPFLFGLALAVLVLLIRAIRARRDYAALALTAAMVLFYNGFLLLTYIGHFPGIMSLQAHSYFRYNTHLSMLLVLALTLTARQTCPVIVPRWHGYAGLAAMLAILITPVAFADRLRFDRDMPQPLVWWLAGQAAPLLAPDDRLALMLPGDNGSVAAMLRGVLRFTPPRRLNLDLYEATRAGPDDFAAAAASGYHLALLSCTNGNGLGLPPDSAALLAWEGDHWTARAIWPYPQGAAHKRWSQILSGGPLCHSP